MCLISKLIERKIPLFYLDLKRIVNRGFIKFTGTSFCELHESHCFKNAWPMILSIQKYKYKLRFNEHFIMMINLTTKST